MAGQAFTQDREKLTVVAGSRKQRRPGRAAIDDVIVESRLCSVAVSWHFRTSLISKAGAVTAGCEACLLAVEEQWKTDPSLNLAC
jgi:hypothetical protein